MVTLTRPQQAMHSTHPYDALTPDVILAAVEQLGVRCTGALAALNSYENRVYRVDTEEHGPWVAKFYRPARWTDVAIFEEHAFAQRLVEHEIPAVAPLEYDARTLHRHDGFRFAVFPWQPGRAPELSRPDEFTLLGRYLGRMHRVSRAEPFEHRLRLTVAEYGTRSAAMLLESEYIPPDLRAAFRAISEQVLAQVTQAFEATRDVAWLPIHGDFHLGNILWSVHGPHLVDFDDCLMGPPVQDIWMALSGEREEMEPQLAAILSGYTEFAEFDPLELRLIEPLRTLRILRYNAWLAARWDDPAFPRNFPWFTAPRYWEQQILTLKQQAAALDEPPLAWRPE